MVYKKVVFSFIIFLTLFTSCNTNEPDSTPANIEFAAEDASCTEAWIKLEADNIKAAQVFREDSLIYSFNTNSIDTVLYDEGLLPNQSYKYKLTIQHPLANGNNSAVNKELTLQTMDTTSHNFTWQTFTFGQHSSSVLYDVAIINENNIWAVGEIYLKDSLGNPDPNAYNAVHWDGSEWELKKITVDFRGSLITPPLTGVFTFSGTDIWFVGSLPIHGDGISWQMYDLRTTVDPNLLLMKTWGTNSNDIYFVGLDGNIAHYSGASGGWQKIESGTDLNIYDIWGIDDLNSDKLILCVATNLYTNDERNLLRINPKWII